MTNPVYNFDTIPERAGTGTVKFDLREQLFGRPDVIPMWVADMDFECPAEIREAIVRRAGHNVYGYDFGGERCRSSLQGWLSRRNGWAVEGEWMRFTTGVVAGLGFAIRAFTAPGDGVVIQTPIYPPFRRTTEANGRRVVTNPLTADLRIDFEGLEKCFADGARAIILCNPHNPTGRVFSRDELQRLGSLCERFDVTIIADEIHSDLVFAPHRHVHIGSIFPRRTITFVAPSKTFNIAGLATSAAIIADETMRARWDEEYARLHIIDGTLFGHIALCAAYDRCEGWLDALIPYIKGNVDYVCEFLAANVPSVRCAAPEGTYLMWLDFRALLAATSRGDGELRDTITRDAAPLPPKITCGRGDGGARDTITRDAAPLPPKITCGRGDDGAQKRLMTWLACEAGLGLSSGADFGCEGVGFARLNAATNRATIIRALDQLAAAVSRL